LFNKVFITDIFNCDDFFKIRMCGLKVFQNSVIVLTNKLLASSTSTLTARGDSSHKLINVYWREFSLCCILTSATRFTQPSKRPCIYYFLFCGILQSTPNTLLVSSFCMFVRCFVLYCNRIYLTFYLFYVLYKRYLSLSLSFKLSVIQYVKILSLDIEIYTCLSYCHFIINEIRKWLGVLWICICTAVTLYRDFCVCVQKYHGSLIS